MVKRIRYFYKYSLFNNLNGADMKSIHKLISTELSSQIEEMVKKIKEFFGIDISGVQASKIISWKAKCYNGKITEQKLIQILGGRA